MINKFIKALVVILLLTLFSCSGEIQVERNLEEGILPPAIPTISGYKQRVIDLPSGTLIEIISKEDTFLVYTRRQFGMVLLKKSPIK